MSFIQALGSKPPSFKISDITSHRAPVSRTQVDGNTEDKDVQEKFIGVLMETMKGDQRSPTRRHHPRRDDRDREYPGDGTVLHDLEGPETEPDAAASEGPSGSVAGPAAPRQNGYIPNADHKNAANYSNANDKRGRDLRYDVRNMYAQIGSYPNGSES